MLPADLMTRYGLPESEALKAIEYAVTKTLTNAFHTHLSVRVNQLLKLPHFLARELLSKSRLNPSVASSTVTLSTGSNQVTTHEVEQDVLKVQDILGLQPREFYMLTYSGRFKGTTLDAKKPEVKVVFPDAPSVVSSLLAGSPEEPQAAP